MTATGNFIFICPACGYKARLPEQFSGRTIKCPGCQAPQIATAPLNTEHKTASFIRVAATPVPFTMPQEQIDALAGAQISSVAPAANLTTSANQPPAVYPVPAPKTFPSPLPGAIQITTDRFTNQTSSVPAAGAPLAKAAVGGTVDFTCNSCHARLRLPEHYAGKSILCPKCSTPQKVLVSQSTVPMDTTRSIALRGDSSSPTPINPGTGTGTGSGTGTGTGSGTGTGIRVRVTPIPSTYPTPLPTAMTAPQTDSLGLLRPSPFASPVPAQRATTPTAAAPEPEAELASVIDAIASDSVKSEEAPVKPHPSRGKLKTEGIKRPVTAVDGPTSLPPAPTRKSSTALIATAGILVVVAIALAAGLAYYALALGETRSRLDEAQRIAKDSAEREHTATKKASERDTRIAELEAALRAANEKAAMEKAAADHAKATTETPVPPVEPVVEPAVGTPVEESPK